MNFGRKKLNGMYGVRLTIETRGSLCYRQRKNMKLGLTDDKKKVRKKWDVMSCDTLEIR